MITNIEIKNFKSLQHVNLELRNLNLLTGLNGSGKSSLIQTLLLLRQSKHELIQQHILRTTVSYAYELCNVGVVKDIYTSGCKEQLMYFRLKFAGDSKANFDFKVTNPIGNSDYLECADTYTALEFENYALFNQKFQYLKTERISPKDYYPASVENAIKHQSLGNSGEHTVFYLETYGKAKQVNEIMLNKKQPENKLLITQTEAWLSEISPNTRIFTELLSSGQEVELKFAHNNYSYKPKNVGFGLSYVLPVIVSLLTAEEGKLIIIENPESHIHPKGQTELGKLIALAAQTGSQIIVETHSDHILNGIRIACKENLIDTNNVISYYFNRNLDTNNSEITPIVIDKNGKLWRKTNEGKNTQIPKGFFDEWTDSMLKLF